MSLTILELSNPQLRVRDMFVLMCTTSLRYSDLKQINKSNVRDNFLFITHQKTKVEVSIPLNKYSKDILERFEHNIPIIDLGQFNQSIKRVCKVCKLDTDVEVVEFYHNKKEVSIQPKYKLVSSHTGRRTFITNLIKKNISHQIIMKISGHTTYESFQKYIKLELTDIENVLANVFD